MATGVSAPAPRQVHPPRPVLPARPRKTYTGTIRFGFATDTYDSEGTAAADPQPLAQSLDQLRALAAQFHGQMDQAPPHLLRQKDQWSSPPTSRLARRCRSPRQARPCKCPSLRAALTRRRRSLLQHADLRRRLRPLRRPRTRPARPLRSAPLQPSAAPKPARSRLEQAITVEELKQFSLQANRSPPTRIPEPSSPRCPPSPLTTSSQAVSATACR